MSKILSRACVLALFLLAVFSCRNENMATDFQNSKREEDFFKNAQEKTSRYKDGKKIINALMKKNEKSHFIISLKDQIGLPNWENIKRLKTTIKQKGDNTSEIYALPLTLDNYISSLLFIEMQNNTVINISNITNNNLWNIINNPNIQTIEKESLLALNLLLDHVIYGESTYINIPKGLLGIPTEYNGKIKIRTENKPENTEGLIFYADCIITIINCNCLPENRCDICQRNGNCIPVSTNCDYTLGGIPGGGGDYPPYNSDPKNPNHNDPPMGGGDNPPSGPDNPSNPCTSTQGPFYRPMPGCDNGDESPTPQNECETLRKAKENSQINNAINTLKTKTIKKKEFAYSISRKYENSTQNYSYSLEFKEGDNFNTTVPTGEYIKGHAHNHPKNGQSIPSISDVIWVKTCQENIVPSSAVAYNIIICPNPSSPKDTDSSLVYAITINSNNAINLSTKIDEMWNRDDLQGKNDDEKRKILNSEFAKKFANVQNSSTGMEKKFLELYQDFGIKLMKFNNLLQKWENLVLENNNVTPKPCI